MIDTLYVVESPGTYPYRNLAYEAALLDTVPPGTMVLYLWRNAHTVVVGRHQNIWKECRVRALEADGGYPVRRLSGGGAVYHDEANLNFTFIVRAPDYDVVRQADVILRAVRTLGLSASRSGRNDLVIDGRKFSGHAYYRSGDRCYHHGTVLVDVNTDAMARYLQPSPAKLKSKGVDSVRSRVVNLRSLLPDLTMDALKAAMREAAEAVYGLPAIPFEVRAIAPEPLAAREAQFSDPAWIYGRDRPFSLEAEDRFDWGSCTLRLRVEDGLIRDPVIYTDCLVPEWIPPVTRALEGRPFRPDALEAMLREDGEDVPRDNVAAGSTADLLPDTGPTPPRVKRDILTLLLRSL